MGDGPKVNHHDFNKTLPYMGGDFILYLLYKKKT